MSVTQYLLTVLVILGSIMIFLTYSPSDQTNFWIFWATVTVLFSLGLLMDILFSADLTFVFDPNPENWRRKTDPQR